MPDKISMQTNPTLQTTQPVCSKEPRSLSLPELVAVMVKYEREHAVEEYTTLGWHVWPLLRTWLTFDLYGYWNQPYSAPRPYTRVGRSFARLRNYWGYARGLARTHLRDRLKYEKPDARGRDIVILTSSNRRTPIGEGLVNRIADPLVEVLKDRGITSLVWEVGETWPRKTPSAWIQIPHALRAKILGRRRSANHAIEQPPWFDELTTWFDLHYGYAIHWNECLSYISEVTVGAEVFQKWLSRIDCKLLIVDCWYSRLAMSATLAASRLGIPSMDIQHGIQAPLHWSYTSWRRVPSQGYEVIPDAFWFWGSRDADAFRDNNDIESQLFVGGNLWLNLWRESPSPEVRACNATAKKLREGFEKSVLVSLYPVDYDVRLLVELIRRSPPGWRWLIRLHPGLATEMENVSRGLDLLKHPGVNVREATKLPLYSLMQACDVHLTSSSTCALEALAFGVSTVVVHNDGRALFEEYINAQVMQFADTIDRILDALHSSESISRDECVRQSQRVFASRQESESVLKHIKALVKDNGCLTT